MSHKIRNLIQQRVFGIACGYEDCNDSARLATDPVQRLLMNCDPVTGLLLASQPTLSRFENQVDGRSLVKMGHAITDTVIARHRKRLKGRVRRITIDMDPTITEKLMKYANRWPLLLVRWCGRNDILLSQCNLHRLHTLHE